MPDLDRLIVVSITVPRQLLLHCPTTVHPWTYAWFYLLRPCSRVPDYFSGCNTARDRGLQSAPTV